MKFMSKKTWNQFNHFQVVPLVQQFCAENGLPYMVDDYLTGWRYEIEQFEKVAKVASKLLKSVD